MFRTGKARRRGELWCMSPSHLQWPLWLQTEFPSSIRLTLTSPSPSMHSAMNQLLQGTVPRSSVKVLLNIPPRLPFVWSFDPEVENLNSPETGATDAVLGPRANILVRRAALRGHRLGPKLFHPIKIFFRYYSSNCALVPGW